jgi:hypothetical protein
LTADVPTIAGIDHSFSFLAEYFKKYSIPSDWPTILDDFQKHWPTDAPNTDVDFIRDGNQRSGLTTDGRCTLAAADGAMDGNCKIRIPF